MSQQALTAPVSPQPSPDDFEQRFARVEALLGELGRSSDPAAQRAAREVLSTVLELHQRGLARVLEIAAREAVVREALAADSRVSAMLLLHGLHPEALGERVSRVLKLLRDRYRSKLAEVSAEVSAEGAVIVHARPVTSACGSTRQTLLKDIEDALLAAAPDAISVRVAEVSAEPALIQLRVREKPALEPALGEQTR